MILNVYEYSTKYRRSTVHYSILSSFAPKSLMSSAKATMLLLNYSSNKSFINAIISSELRIEPCKRPPDIGNGSD